MANMDTIVYEFTLDELIEQLIEIADALRLKSQHDEPFLDDLFEMGERLDNFASWIDANIPREDK